MTSGYSKTPLAKKLGLKDGMTVNIYGTPQEYPNFFVNFPLDIQIPKNPQHDSIDFIHIFCTELSQLEKTVHDLKPALKKNGIMWVSWPKGGSKITTDIKREPLREIVLGAGLVDVKVCAVDENWSGLKFVYRLKDR